MISINAVYTAVQAVLNKENRGLLKPEDFNNFAKLSLYNILEGVKSEYDTALTELPKGKIDKSSMVYLDEVMNGFHKTSSVSVVGGKYAKPSDFDFLEALYYNDIEISQASVKDTKLMNTISFMTPSDNTPVYIEYEDGYEVVSESINGDIDMYYFREPLEPKWTYQVIANNIVYDGGNSSKQDIELPVGYFNKIVIDILFYAGLNIRDEQVLSNLLKDKDSDSSIEYRDKILTR